MARTILAAADEHDARIIVPGLSSRTDLPLLPCGLEYSRGGLGLIHQPLAGRPKTGGARGRRW